MIDHRFTRLVILVAALSLPCGAALAGPITFNTALPVPENQGIIRGQAAVVRAGDDPSPADRSLTAVAAPSVLAYGVTSRVALFAVVPFIVHKSLDVTTPMGRVNRSATGFGDSSFFGRYTLLQVDRPGATFRIAPFAGFKAPTGEDGESDRLGRLPRPPQPGSGSWDGFLGSTLTWQKLAWEVDADGGYRFNNRDEGFEFGDAAFADASFQYRIWPRELGPGVPGFLYAVLETNVEWREKDRAGGRVDANSGGWRWFVDPGIQYVAKRYVLEAVVQLPAVQELHGNALETDYQVRAGFRWNFWLPYP